MGMICPPFSSAHANIMLDSQHPEGMKKIKALEDRKADEPAAVPDKVSKHKHPPHLCIIHIYDYLWLLTLQSSKCGTESLIDHVS